MYGQRELERTAAQSKTKKSTLLLRLTQLLAAYALLVEGISDELPMCATERHGFEHPQNENKVPYSLFYDARLPLFCIYLKT